MITIRVYTSGSVHLPWCKDRLCWAILDCHRPFPRNYNSSNTKAWQNIPINHHLSKPSMTLKQSILLNLSNSSFIQFGSYPFLYCHYVFICNGSRLSPLWHWCTRKWSGDHQSSQHPRVQVIMPESPQLHGLCLWPIHPWLLAQAQHRPQESGPEKNLWIQELPRWCNPVNVIIMSPKISFNQ